MRILFNLQLTQPPLHSVTFLSLLYVAFKYYQLQFVIREACTTDTRSLHVFLLPQLVKGQLFKQTGPLSLILNTLLSILYADTWEGFGYFQPNQLKYIFNGSVVVRG